MNRRQFLHKGSTALAIAAAATYVPTTFAVEPKPKRVGLIGTGWYGKADLLRLIQVAPVDVVSLCDVDKRMLDEAGKLVASRQKSGKTPRLYSDYRKMLAERDLDVVLIGTPDHWHALPVIAGGIARGPQTPYQEANSSPGMPASADVGICCASATRLREVIAMPLTPPLCTSGSSARIGSSSSCTFPAATSVSAGAVPR